MNTQILAKNEEDRTTLDKPGHSSAKVLLLPINGNSVVNDTPFTEINSHKAFFARNEYGVSLPDDHLERQALYPEQLWIAALYRDIFQRGYDEDGLDYWLKERLKGIHPMVIVADFCHSLEYGQSFIVKLYEKLLYRIPDNEGLVYWSKALQCGISQQAVITEFMASEEFLQRHPLPYDFVDSLYRILLKRAPDTTGYLGWVERLKAGWTPAQVADEFIHSEEYCRRLTGEFFVEYLRREPNSDEWDYWTGALMTGQALQQIVIRCLSSNEYRRMCIKGWESN